MNPLSKSSHIELSTAYLKQNLAFVRGLLNPGVELSVVVKGNAYGHGIHQFVPLAEAEGVRHFSVYGIEEALDFKTVASSDSHLMIMGYIAPENLAWVIEKGYSFFVYDLFELQSAISTAKKCDVKAKVHIELETGMNRTGIEEPAFDQLIAILQENEAWLKLSGCCTHLAGAENIQNFPRIKKQIERYNRYIQYFLSKGLTFEKKHIDCSAGLIRFPETQFDMVRIGILIYGFWPSRETLTEYLIQNSLEVDPLTSVLSWKTKIMTVKHVEQGEYIGYGTSYLTNRKTKIAIIPVGYAYGYARSLSNQGHVLIHGERVSVIGTVNMNMIAIDVTEIDNVKQGDEVVIIGFQGDSRITVSSFGEMTSQMNYELLARLPHNIPRIVKSWPL